MLIIYGKLGELLGNLMALFVGKFVFVDFTRNYHNDRDIMSQAPPVTSISITSFSIIVRGRCCAADDVESIISIDLL